MNSKFILRTFFNKSTICLWWCQLAQNYQTTNKWITIFWIFRPLAQPLGCFGTIILVQTSHHWHHIKLCFKKIAQPKTYINDFGGKWWCKYIVIMAVCTVRIITVYVGQSQWIALVCMQKPVFSRNSHWSYLTSMGYKVLLIIRRLRVWGRELEQISSIRPQVQDQSS